MIGVHVTNVEQKTKNHDHKINVTQSIYGKRKCGKYRTGNHVSAIQQHLKLRKSEEVNSETTVVTLQRKRHQFCFFQLHCVMWVVV